MKRCPECRRDYYDDSLLYCLDDGSALLEGPASFDEPVTAILHETAPPSEAATRQQLRTTEQTALLPPISLPRASRNSSLGKVALLSAFVAALVAASVITYRSCRSESVNTINSIAVLPFENRSGNADTDYLTDGLTDS